MKKVLIADDHSLFSKGMASIFEEDGSFTNIGFVSNGKDVLYKVISLQPDILILDLNLPGKNGLKVLREVKDYSDQVNVIIVTMYNDATFIKEARRAGAGGYFLKNSDPEELLIFLKARSDEFYLSKSLDRPRNFDLEIEDDFTSIVRLTAREKDILRQIVSGKSSKEIGDELNISPSTVDTHRKNMLRKLSFNKVSELVSYAYRNNLV